MLARTVIVHHPQEAIRAYLELARERTREAFPRAASEGREHAVRGATQRLRLQPLSGQIFHRHGKKVL